MIQVGGAGLSSRRPRFNPRPFYAKLVMEKVVRRGFSQSTSVFPVCVIPPMFHTQSPTTCNYLILALDCATTHLKN